MDSTPDQNKSFLALLQGSSHLRPHSVNPLISKPNLGMSIIRITRNTPKSEIFILDIGAIDHVCYTRKKFHCLKRIKYITIKLPNGDLVTTYF